MLDFLLEAGEIAGICSAVATLISAIGACIWKIKKSPKTWKELFSDIINNKSKEVQELAGVAKEAVGTIKDITKKELEKKDGKKAV